jgi:hypothetical protein
MEKLLFRASRAGMLMTEPRNKSDKEAGNLSETSKTFVEDMFLKNEYGYEEPVLTDEMLKGLLCEQDSLRLVQSVLGGEFRIKNKEYFENDFICGTPDIILKSSDYVEDVKTSFTIKTFFRSELLPVYYWQAQCYMALTGKKNYRLIYCLVNTPQEIVTELKKRIYFRYGCEEENNDYQNASMQIEKNHNYEHIAKEKRIRVFDFPFEKDKIELLYKKVENARIYYNSLFNLL